MLYPCCKCTRGGLLCGMSKPKGAKKAMTAQPMTATIFADRMGVNYSTAIRWLKKKLVPGAELKESPERGKWWEIPEEALTMERPRWGGPTRGGGQKKGSDQ